MSAHNVSATIRKENRINKFGIADGIMTFILSVWGLLIIYPFYNTILVSLVPQVDYTRNPFMLFPTRITWDSYEFVFDSKLLLGSMGNSVLLTIVGTIYNMVLTVLTAFVLTKPLPGRNLFRFLLVFTMYFNGGLIPNYLLIKDLGLMDSFWSMLLPSVVSVMYVMIVSNYFVSIPAELQESASIDGANDFTIMWKIILPLSLPILATFTIYYAVERWNEWYSGMLYIKDAAKWPLQLTLRKLISDANVVNQASLPGEEVPITYAEGVKMAAIVVTMFPIMAVYPFLQRYFLTGLTMGAVKG